MILISSVLPVSIQIPSGLSHVTGARVRKVVIMMETDVQADVWTLQPHVGTATHGMRLPRPVSRTV
jgi:hypothetical protein